MTAQGTTIIIRHEPSAGGRLVIETHPCGCYPGQCDACYQSEWLVRHARYATQEALRAMGDAGLALLPADTGDCERARETRARLEEMARA